MKVLVLGGGVIGVTSAYYLARAGAEVTVLDRQAAPASETSFANAGQVSPGYSTPWAAPGIPLKALKWMLQEHAPLAVRLSKTMMLRAGQISLEDSMIDAQHAVMITNPSADVREGIAAFREKRPARFEGK